MIGKYELESEYFARLKRKEARMKKKKETVRKALALMVLCN